MDRLGPYEELAPALGRTDAFFAVRRFPADPEPFLCLLLMPEVDEARIFRAVRLHHRAQGRFLLRLVDSGVENGRHYWAMDLGPRSKALRLRRMDEELPPAFWRCLAGAVGDLHRQGIVHRGLSESTVAVTDMGEPALFDLLSARGTRADETPDLIAGDVADLTELFRRWGPAAGSAPLRTHTPSSLDELIEYLA